MNTIALFERPLLLQVNVSMHYTCVRMPVAAEVVQSNGHFLVAVRCCLFSTRAATCSAAMVLRACCRRSINSHLHALAIGRSLVVHGRRLMMRALRVPSQVH